MSDDRRDFIAEVAWLHHGYHRNQEEIASRLGVSRSTISRALADAERLGIVQVTVTVPMPRETQLAAELSTRIGVPATVGVRLAEDASSAAARMAARVIERIADGGDATIAVSWGRTMTEVAGFVRPRATSGLTVVDAVGHAGGTGMIPAVEVTRRLSVAFAACAEHLPAPVFLPDGRTREAIVASKPVSRVLQLARAADVTIVSVGVVGGASLLVSGGLIDSATMDRVVGAGAVGEILGWWFDADGREVSARVPVPVGLGLEDLRVSRRVIAVAGGEEKAGAVAAAIRGGIVREIVVDDGLAEALLRDESATATAT